MAKEQLSSFNQKLMTALGKKEGIATPKMTINKLGEYIVANPKRQRRILEQLKYPEENRFGAVAHQEAREAIKQYFVNNFDDTFIHSCIADLHTKTATNDFQQALITSSIEGLEKVLDSEVINKDLEYDFYTGSNPKLNINGVEISVFPDLIVKSKVRGKEYAGALKLHLSKNSVITDEGNKYIGAMLHNFGTLHIESSTNPIRCENFISYDIFKDVFVECPRSIVTRMDHIEACCLNIVAIWASI
jgi:hypothetical protein